MLETTDFGPNPHVPKYKNFGCVEVRYAKGTRGSGPRRRTVLTSPEFEWVVGLLTSGSPPPAARASRPLTGRSACGQASAAGARPEALTIPPCREPPPGTFTATSKPSRSAPPDRLTTNAFAERRVTCAATGDDGPMVNNHSGQEPPMVRLPTEWGRTREALHALAWRDLLDLFPGTLESLLGLAASRTGTTAVAMSEGVTVGFAGRCGSDLFVVCDECQGDRAVIELKGPTAQMNPRKDGDAEVWQTVFYRNIYLADPARTCEHLPIASPFFILLDAQNRTRQVIEENECWSEPALDGWAVLAYEDVLSEPPFVGLPLAEWLLRR